jgi:hypothetical protein
MPYVCLVGKGELIGGKIKLSSEHTRHRWVTLEKALNLKITETTRKSIIAFLSSNQHNQ